jgi:hypothetical protein
MFFPKAVAAPVELLAGNGLAVAGGSATAVAGEDCPAGGGTAAEIASGGPGAAPCCASADTGEVGREGDGAGDTDGPPMLIT